MLVGSTLKPEEDGHVSKATYSAVTERADAIGVSDEFVDAAEASDAAAE